MALEVMADTPNPVRSLVPNLASRPKAGPPMLATGFTLTRGRGDSFRRILLGTALAAAAAMTGSGAEAGPLFTAPFLSFDTGNHPISLAVGDLNGDGKPDLAAASYGSDVVSVLFGNGDGTFGARTDFRTGSGPYSVAIGDLDGDGKPDLAVAD